MAGQSVSRPSAARHDAQRLGPGWLVPSPTSGRQFRSSLGPDAHASTILSHQSPSVGSGVLGPSDPGHGRDRAQLACLNVSGPPVARAGIGTRLTSALNHEWLPVPVIEGVTAWRCGPGTPPGASRTSRKQAAQGPHHRCPRRAAGRPASRVTGGQAAQASTAISPRQASQAFQSRPTLAGRTPALAPLVGCRAGTAATFRLATAARFGNYYAEGI